MSQAAAHQKLGDMYRIIGRYDEADDHYARSRRLAEDLLGDEPDNIAIGEVLYQTRMGFGLLNMAKGRFALARTEFEHAANISAVIAAADPTRDAGRRGLIEAYLQIGRAHSFLHEFGPAGTWFRRMQDLATIWVAEEPANFLARDLLASSLRKLADLKKFSKDWAAPSEIICAIAIGRELLQREPLNLDFKAHLATAIDDLAGVVRDQGDLDAARRIFQEAETLCEELVESDSDNLQYRTRLIHTQTHRAAVERELSEFNSAAEIYQTALDHLRRLEREGRLERGRSSNIDAATLESEIAYCEAAPRALIDVGFARSRPPALAARLLLLRARTLANHQVVMDSAAICALKADEPESLYDVADIWAS